MGRNSVGVVCHELRQLFSAHLAPVLPCARARILDERDGEGRRGDAADGGARGGGERPAFRPLESQGGGPHPGSQRFHGVGGTLAVPVSPSPRAVPPTPPPPSSSLLTP